MSSHKDWSAVILFFFLFPHSFNIVPLFSHFLEARRSFQSFDNIHAFDLAVAFGFPTVPICCRWQYEPRHNPQICVANSKAILVSSERTSLLFKQQLMFPVVSGSQHEIAAA